MRKIRTYTLLFLASVVLAFSTPSNAASKDEKAIRATVNQFFKHAKSYSTKGRKCFKSQKSLKVMASNKLTKGLRKTVKTANKKFLKYKIKSVKIASDKKSATVKVKATRFYGEDVFTLALFSVAFSDYDDDELMKNLSSNSWSLYKATIEEKLSKKRNENTQDSNGEV